VTSLPCQPRVVLGPLETVFRVGAVQAGEAAFRVKAWSHAQSHREAIEAEIRANGDA